MSEVKGNVRVEVFIAINPARLEELEFKLDEQLDEMGKHWQVRHTSTKLWIVAEIYAKPLHNGSTSAVAEVMATLDSALSEVAEFRWFDRVSISAELTTYRDEELPPGKEDGAELEQGELD
jgi:hypothetical protein